MWQQKEEGLKQFRLHISVKIVEILREERNVFKNSKKKRSGFDTSEILGCFYKTQPSMKQWVLKNLTFFCSILKYYIFKEAMVKYLIIIWCVCNFYFAKVLAQLSKIYRVSNMVVCRASTSYWMESIIII